MRSDNYHRLLQGSGIMWHMVMPQFIGVYLVIASSNLLVVVVQILIVLLVVVLDQKLLPVGMEAATA